MSVFLTLGAVGLIVVVVALVLGDVLDGVFHVDFLSSDLFSTAGVGAFIGALGFGGAIALSLFPVLWVALTIGVLTGVLAAWGAAWVTGWLKRGESGALSSSSLVGVAGRVITPVPSDGYGEVRLTSGGYSHKITARCSQTLPGGTEVWVSAILSPTAVEVEPARAVEPPPDLS